ncbi:VOC family protein [Paenibacillus segetis]|uniref:VOC domain-containing protein n=1 Tax=Paenibacillus segetis TaxID=1325360 RepID=A0ABQ1YK87_9BACL|nr:VOC family protein [Paenibacillus segetis]GGH27711.1 hypothetical protein GCM10008013_29300 [Paenibacillus segetis]
MNNHSTELDTKHQLKFGTTIQVRLVSDLKKSQEYYRDVLGCKIDDWGHAERDGMIVILQQAISHEDVRPNAPSKKRTDYPTEWEGPEYGWDTFIHVGWNDIHDLTEEIRNKGGLFPNEPVTGSHGNWEFKNVYLQDPDKYTIVLGAMREIKG